MARLGEIQIRGDGSDPRQIMNYLLQMEEQIQYALSHIGSENIQAGAMDEKQLAPALKQNIQSIEARVESQERTGRELKSADKKILDKLSATADGLREEYAEALKKYSTAAETKRSISDYVSRNAYKKQADTEITGNGIEIGGGKHLKLGYGGAFSFQTDRMKVSSEDNTLYMKNADGDDTLRCDGDGVKIRTLYLYDSQSNTYKDVTAAVLALLS